MLEKIKPHLLKVLIGFLVILVFAVAILGVYRLGQKKTQNSRQIISTCLPEETSEKANDSIEDWKTYTNVKYGYKIIYPEILEFPKDETFRDYTIDPRDPEALKKISHKVSSAYPKDSPEWAIHISTWDNPKKLSFDKWMAFKMEPSEYEGYDIKANFLVDNEKAFRAWSGGTGTDLDKPGTCGMSCPMLSVYTVRGDKAYRIEIQYFRRSPDDESQEIFNLMLSTFRFLD